MRLRSLAIVLGLLLMGYPVVGSGQTSGVAGNGHKSESAASSWAVNGARLGSEKNPVRVSSGVMMGLLTHREIPHYPVPKCGDPAYSGQVVTRAIINPEGKVDKLTVISGPAANREANLAALRQWTYKPYLLNGTAVWVQTQITVIVDFGRCEPK